MAAEALAIAGALRRQPVTVCIDIVIVERYLDNSLGIPGPPMATAIIKCIWSPLDSRFAVLISCVILNSVVIILLGRLQEDRRYKIYTHPQRL